MTNFEQAVFISYAWGGEGEEIVNQIDSSLQKRGTKIIRDKRDLGYKGSIKDFMERIGQGNCVIVVISDEYLRSPNCMFELVEIADNKQFHDRIFPIVLDDANIYDPLKRVEYVGYWETKRAELAAAINMLDPANLQGIREDLDLYDCIRDKISGLTSLLKDMNTLTPEMHLDSNFDVLFASLEKRMQQGPSIEKIDRKQQDTMSNAEDNRGNVSAPNGGNRVSETYRPIEGETALGHNHSTSMQTLDEYSELLEECMKRLNQLAVEIERLELKKIEYEAYHILYVQYFSKYLLEQKDLQIECDTLRNTIQMLQYICKHEVRYVELQELSCGESEHQIVSDHQKVSLREKSNTYEFSCQGKDLYISALLSNEFPVSKHSFPESILGLAILDSVNLFLTMENKILAYEIKIRYFQLEEIKALLGFSESKSRYQQEKSKINDFVSVKVEQPSLEEEDIDEMKKMYREIMMHTHPDVYGGGYPKDWSVERKERFDRIVRDSITAYRNCDIEALRQTYETIKGTDILKKELENRRDLDQISYLQNKISWYTERVKVIRSKIEAIQKSEIYDYRNVLQSPEKREETRQKLEETNAQLYLQVITLREELNQLFDSYRKQAGNE